MYTYKTGLSTSEHDRFVIDSPQTNLLQSSSWAKIKDSWGNDRLGFYQDGNLVAVASVLIQPLPFGFSMIYIPRGPIMDYQDKELLAFVMASLKKYAKTKRALFVKFDPSLFVTKNLIYGFWRCRPSSQAAALPPGPGGRSVLSIPSSASYLFLNINKTPQNRPLLYKESEPEKIGV